METSKASAMPIKDGTGTVVAGGGKPPYDGSMDHRITALESRFDTILPTLATKADVGEIRADLHKMNAEIKTWTLAMMMMTTIGTMLAAIFGISQIFKGSAPAVPLAQPAPIIITIPIPATSTPPQAPR